MLQPSVILLKSEMCRVPTSLVNEKFCILQCLIELYHFSNCHCSVNINKIISNAFVIPSFLLASFII